MSSEVKKTFSNTVEAFQRASIYILLFLLPLSTLPFPWDWTEKGPSLVILFFTFIILFLWIIKIFWEGKLEIIKDKKDLVLIALTFSIIISTIFAFDINSAILGLDSRLGGGILMFVFALLLSISSRTYIKDIKHIYNLLFSFIVGILLIDIFSFLSFLQIDFLKLLPIYGNLYTLGLPWVGSANIHLVLNSVAFLSSIMLLILSFIKGYELKGFVVGLSLFINIVNLCLFSLNQGVGIVYALIGVLILLLAFSLLKEKFIKKRKILIISILSSSLILLLIPFILFQIPSIREDIISDKIQALYQLTLGSDISWRVSSSSAVNSFARGLLGLGPDSFAIAFNQYKPLSDSLLMFNSKTFYYGSNEIFTQITNGGLLWFLVWISLGYVLIKGIIKDLKNFEKIKKTENRVLNLWLNTITVFVYLLSVFSYFNITIKVIFFLLITLVIIFKNILKEDKKNLFILKFWAIDVNEDNKTVSKSLKNVNIFFTVILSIFLIVSILWVTRLTIGSLYVLRAEEKLVMAENRSQEEVIPDEEKELILDNIVSLYERGMNLDGKNPLYGRKLSLLYLEKTAYLKDEYQNTVDQQRKNDLMYDLSILKNLALDTGKISIDYAPGFSANWKSRASLYLGLVSIGFQDYASDASYSISRAEQLEPLNYEIYYNKAQVFTLQGEREKALSSLSQALSINGQHVPSLILSGEINKELGRTDVYISYLQAAKTILEIGGQENTVLYENIVKEIGNTSIQLNEENETEQEQQSQEPVDTENEDL